MAAARYESSAYIVERAAAVIAENDCQRAMIERHRSLAQRGGVVALLRYAA